MNELSISKVSNRPPHPSRINKKEIYQLFIEFIASSGIERAEMFNVPMIINSKGVKQYEKIPSERDFAIKYGLSRRTTWLWKSTKGFGSSVNDIRLKKGSEKTPNVMEALYRRCLRFGMSNDVELWLQYYEGWSRLQRVEVVQRFAPDDIGKVMKYLPKEKQQYWYEQLKVLFFDLREAGYSATGAGVEHSQSVLGEPATDTGESEA